MNSRNWKRTMLLLTLASIVTIAACHKKPPAAPPPPPPPPPAAPTASITANPTTINTGQSTTLTWQTSNATDVTIEGIGAVQPSGSQSVQPTDSTTYRLVAKGPGGTQDATARVTVSAPTQAPAPAPSLSDEQAFQQQVKDIYFDYDKYDVRPSDQAVLQQDVQFMQQHPNVTITIEGHCDERGSTEYNLALGDNRANSVMSAMQQAGVPANRMKKISYGKEKPFCTESTEQCWQQNRRAHFVFGMH